MDYGQAEFIVSDQQHLLIINSERKPGFAYKFCRKTNNEFRCASCKKLGKSRSVTVKNQRVVCKKHPEDDHHKDCQPLHQNEIDALRLITTRDNSGKRKLQSDRYVGS